MVLDDEHFNVIVKVTRAGKTPYHPGKPTERITEDILSIVVKADSKDAAIDKAIRLIDTERTDDRG